MYSRLIAGLKKANIALNRKMLSEIAIADPTGFDAIVAAAKPSAI
jgi:large subunit ribosomal protein L20